MRDNIHWGPPLESLPSYTWQEFKALCDSNEAPQQLICIAGVLYNISWFINKHPGGKNIILANIAKDVTAMFHGGVHHRECTI